MRKTAIYFGFALSAVLLWLVVRKIDLPRMVETVRTIKWWYFVLSLVFFLFTIYSRALRWRYLLATKPPIPVPALFSATSIGLLINNVLPIRMGDIARAYLIGKKAAVSGITAFATLAVERIMDILCLLSILAFYLLFSAGGQVQVAHRQLGALGLTFLVVLTAGILGVYLAYVYHRPLENLLHLAFGRRFPRLAEKMLDLFSKTLAGFTAVRDAHQLLRVILFTFCLWLAGATSYFYLMEAFSFPLRFTSGLLVLVFVTFGVAFPSAPGYVGTFHAFCILGLSVAGLQNYTQAASYAFTLHAMEWTSSTALGTYFLWREGLSFKAIRAHA